MQTPLPIQPGSGRERAAERWGAALNGGFTVVPEVLLRNQARLGITARELNLVLQLLSFWWRSSYWPRPRVSVLATRMGVDERSVQRALASLQGKGLVRRALVPTENGETMQGYDLTGLVTRLQLLALDVAPPALGDVSAVQEVALDEEF